MVRVIGYILASEATSKHPPPDLEFGKIKIMPYLSAFGINCDSLEYA